MKRKKSSFNAMAFLVNHSEKLGLALCAFIVISIWGGNYFGGSWSRETRNPDQLLQDVNKKTSEIDSPNNVWPEKERLAYQLVDFSEIAATLLRPMNASRYELSTPLFTPLNRPKEKAREVEYLAVESLDAIPGHVILAILPEDSFYDSEHGENAEDPSLADENSTETPVDDRFRRRDSKAAMSAGGGGGAFQGGGLRRREKEEEEATDLNRQRATGTNRFQGGGRKTNVAPPKKKTHNISAGAMESGGRALAGQIDAERSEGMNNSTRGLSGQKPAGRFYVAVRGVWPVRRQLVLIQKALNLSSPRKASEYLELLDFVLERQIASQGDDPWTKPWVQVDIGRAMESLKEVDGTDDEVVEMEVIDPVITMPLPMRAFGVWGEAATHSRIKNYLLTKEGREREDKIMTLLKEEAEKRKLQEKKLPKQFEKGGFASQTEDIRSIANEFSRSDSRGLMSLTRGLSDQFKKDQPGGNNRDQDADNLKSKLTAAGEYLLFRYYDFDVRPGYAYRYRVKLKLKNPSLDAKVTDVVDPSVAEGDYRETPLSKCSNAALLPVSPRYYLYTGMRNPLTDAGHHRGSLASVSMIEYHKEYGTRVSSVVNMDMLGQFVGGNRVVEVLDVTLPGFSDQEYPFSSEDVLMDVRTDVELSPSDHPDLNLVSKKGHRSIDLGMTPEILVLNSGGELHVLNGARNSSEELALQAELKAERKVFEDVKKMQEAAESRQSTDSDTERGGGFGGALGRSGMGGFAAEDNMMSGGARSKKKGRDPRRKTSRAEE